MLMVTYQKGLGNIHEGDTAILTKEESDFVLISREHYKELEKAFRNAEYLKSIDESIEELESGGGEVHALIEN